MNPNPQPMPPMQPPMQAPPGFFKRNWKWMLPVGCITPFLCCGVFGAVVWMGASAAIKSSGAYVQAVGRAVANPEVHARLGDPITPGWQITGEINEKNGAGTSDFSVPLSGPKGKGTLRVVATKKSGGQWTYTRLAVETETGKSIDLLGAEDKAAPEDPIDDIEPDPVRLPDTMDEPLIDKEPWAASKSCEQTCARALKCKVGPTEASDCEEACDGAAENGPATEANYKCLGTAKTCAAMKACEKN